MEKFDAGQSWLKGLLIIFLICYLSELNTIEGFLERVISGLQQNQPVRKVFKYKMYQFYNKMLDCDCFSSCLFAT